MITISIRPDRRQLVVDVEDTGCGIHPDDQERIFELYEKVDIYSTGAGLGLTLASKFATLLHGSVELVSSELNRGSHFRATFRDLDCMCSLVPPPPPLISTLKNLPSNFHSFSAQSDTESSVPSFYSILDLPRLHLLGQDRRLLRHP